LQAGLRVDGIEKAGEGAPADLPVGGHRNLVETIGTFDVIIQWVQRNATAAGGEGEFRSSGAVEAGSGAVQFELEFEPGWGSVSYLEGPFLGLEGFFGADVADGGPVGVPGVGGAGVVEGGGAVAIDEDIERGAGEIEEVRRISLFLSQAKAGLRGAIWSSRRRMCGTRRCIMRTRWRRR